MEGLDHGFGTSASPLLVGDKLIMRFGDYAGLDLETGKELWYTQVSKERYYTSPIVLDGIVYIYSMGNKFQALDAMTGDLIYSHKVEGAKGRAFTGITLVNDKLLIGEEDGTLIFIKPGTEYKELARFNLGENRSTPIFDGDTAYLRTMEHLFAFQDS